MVICMYIFPGQGQTTLWDQTLFIVHKQTSSVDLIICCKFFPLNDCVTVLAFAHFYFYSFKHIGDHILRFLKESLCYLRVTVYIKRLEHKFLMIHVKF